MAGQVMNLTSGAPLMRDEYSEDEPGEGRRRRKKGRKAKRKTSSLTSAVPTRSDRILSAMTGGRRD